jgi:hypothetical protein
VRNAVERRQAELRRRYQCDLLQFWRRCRDTACRRRRSCIGDASACFDRGFASMSEADKEWLRGAIMATVKGARTKGELIRRIDAEIAAARRAKPMDLQGLAAWLQSALAAVAQEAGLAAAPAQDDESELVEWEPMKGSSRDPIRMAALPSSPAPADGPAAEPSPPPVWRWTGPLNPPQATYDEQGRLIIPDRTEYNERVRKGMNSVESGKRGGG